MYLKFLCHGNNLMSGGIVFVTVGEHEPNVCRKLQGICVFSVVHLFL